MDLLAGHEAGLLRADTEDDGHEANVALGIGIDPGGASGLNPLSKPVLGFAAAGRVQTTD